MDTVLHWAAIFAMCCFSLGLACAGLRLLRGPTPQDRVLALDTMYINGMLILLVLGQRFQTPLYFDMALLVAMFGFVSSAAMAKFLLQGEVIKP